MTRPCDDRKRSGTGASVPKIGLALIVFAAGSLSARGDENQPITGARRLVTAALLAELHGEPAQRQRLLSEALAASPHDEAALWQSGYVHVENKWIKFDELAATTKTDNLHNAYLIERNKYGNTAREQLQLADWCSQRGLGEQERAHLTNSLELDPNQPGVRERLGQVQVDGAWLSQREAGGAARQARTTCCGLKKWSPITSGLAERLKSQDSPVRAKAAQELRDIHDPSAIPALEVMATKQPAEIGMLAVEAIAHQHSPRASLALARVSTFATWDPVGLAAAERLQSRHYECFVPALLAAMETSAEMEGSSYVVPSGRLAYRQEFLQEKAGHHELEVLETIFEFPKDPIDSRAHQRNERIAQVLGKATGQKLGADPHAWWKWWCNYNETAFGNEKPIAKELAVSQTRVAHSYDRSLDGQRYACLAAGTSVWTDTGARPIEQIKIGDLVLSQDPETGELAYKPVLRTMTREGASMTRFRAGDEAFRTSGGHLFWLSGTGWDKARDLKPGEQLHALGGSVPVESAELDGTETVYNLVVADFHTYFVGRTKLLSHDVLPRGATMAKLPGLIEPEAP